MTPSLESYLRRYRERFAHAGCRADDCGDEAIVRAIRNVHMAVARRATSMGPRLIPTGYRPERRDRLRAVARRRYRSVAHLARVALLAGLTSDDIMRHEIDRIRRPRTRTPGLPPG